jgi:hypothetical protein
LASVLDRREDADLQRQAEHVGGLLGERQSLLARARRRAFPMVGMREHADLFEMLRVRIPLRRDAQQDHAGQFAADRADDAA